MNNMTYQIKENAKNVWIRDNENTQDLSPLTDANSVYFNSGRTLEQELGKGVMESNIVTVNSSMEKVIDEAYDGVYESCVFKGKSLVNLMTSCKDETLIQYHNPPADSNVANVPMIKPNTVYTIIYSVKYREEGNTGHLIVRTQQDGGDINVSSGFTFGTKYKRFAYKFTTPSTIDYFVLRSNGHYFHVKEVMLLEGDYTNADLPYFEGLCDSKMPILRNVGKNLFDGEVEIGGITNETGLLNNKTELLRSKNPIRVNENTAYVLSNDKKYNNYVYFYSDDDRFISYLAGRENPFRFTTPSNTHHVRFRTTESESQKDLTIKWQLEESSTATTYEDHKTNILRTPEEIVLREVNGVQDTYNAITGEYVQRIGERDYIEGDFTDVNVKTDGVKTQYELTEPVTTIVEPSTIPFIYQNGHIILESGYEGQSLTPILEYTAITNRTGQVENVAKTIRQHEAQLTLLEKMLITNIIELDYNNTLMALNLKMDEVK